MPFCTECGKQVGSTDVFCAGCGARQGVRPEQARSHGSRHSGPRDFAADMNPRTIAALCYIPVMGWIASLYVLAGERFRHDNTVRFHAFQGLYLFVGWLVLDWAIGPFLSGWWRLAGILKAALSVLGIVMLVKTLSNHDERLPFVGDLADRSVREQR